MSTSRSFALLAISVLCLRKPLKDQVFQNYTGPCAGSQPERGQRGQSRQPLATVIIHEFPGGNSEGQTILRRRQRTSCIGSKKARRIYCFIKVKDDSRRRPLILRQFCIQESSGRISGFAARLIAE